MKFKKLIGCFTLAAALAFGVGVGLASSHSEAKVAKAGTGDSDYNVVGVIDGVGTSWDLNNPLISGLDTDEGYLMVKTGWSLKAGDKFKFAKTTWDDALGTDDITSGTAQYYFARDNDGNINVLSNGIYDFYIDSTNTKIKVNFNASSPEATYSYVISYDSNHTTLNAWTDGTIWHDAKPSFAQVNSFSFGGYKIDRFYDPYDYHFYGIYKIDDRFLGNHTTFQLFHDSTYSKSITIDGTQKVYFEDEETSSDANVYAAIKFLFDFGYSRSNYTYAGHAYSASTCAVITAGTASTFLSNYTTISGTVEGAKILNKAWMYVYDVSDLENLDDDLDSETSIATIMGEIAKHVSGGGSGRIMLGADSNSNSTFTVIIIVTSIIALTSICGFIFIKRRKQD